MRVLFTATTPVSKVFPLAGLAWAFRTAGHEVLVTFTEHVALAAGTGLPIVDVAPGYNGAELVRRALAEHPSLAQAWQAPLGDDSAPMAIAVAELNRPLIPGTLDLVDAWHPDLVVYEQSAGYGLVAAAHAGVPAVQRNLGTLRTGGVFRDMAAHLAADLRRHGIRSLPEPMTTVEFVPPSMLPFPEPEGWYMHDLAYAGGAVLDGWPTQPPDRPRVVITSGTVRPGLHGLGPLKPTVAAAAEVDADFILALGLADPAPLGELPPNVRSVGWTPLGPLLRTCSAIVHHGGAGTAMTAIDAGVPQLVLLDPFHLGHKTMAPALEMRGLGLSTRQEDVDAALLRTLLSDETLRTAAAEVRAELDPLPPPATIAAQLAELIERS